MKHAILPLFAAATLALSGCLGAAPLKPVEPSTHTQGALMIANDPGGHVLSAIARRESLAMSGQRVEIRGSCRSACTIYASLPNACLGRGAVLGFHAPRVEGTTLTPPGVTEMMGAFYRGKVRERWFAEWSKSREFTHISAVEFVAMDPQARLCE